MHKLFLLMGLMSAPALWAMEEEPIAKPKAQGAFSCVRLWHEWRLRTVNAKHHLLLAQLNACIEKEKPLSDDSKNLASKIRRLEVAYEKHWKKLHGEHVAVRW